MELQPPLVPHFGRVHETLIKAAKRATYALLGNAYVTDEELMAAFTGAEALVNSRLLTYQSASTSDDLPLTPNQWTVANLVQENGGGVFRSLCDIFGNGGFENGYQPSTDDQSGRKTFR